MEYLTLVLTAYGSKDPFFTITEVCLDGLAKYFFLIVPRNILEKLFVSGGFP
jgi:hypothetical protein